MKLNIPEPTTAQGRYMQRIGQIWLAHPECSLPVGELLPGSIIMKGDKCLVMQSKGPLMIHRFADRAGTQWLFDLYGS
jgi:hypothetical protein